MSTTFALPAPRTVLDAGAAPAPGPAEWTLERRQAVEGYVALVKPLLRLTDWTITFDWLNCPDDDDAFATCSSVGPSRHCELRFSRAFLTLPPHDRTQVVLHELMHCKLFPLENLVDAVCDDTMSRSAKKVMDAAVSQALEYTVDDLADVLLPFVPGLSLPGL